MKQIPAGLVGSATKSNEADPTKKPKGPSEEPANILIVDDRPQNLLTLEAVLDSPDYRLVRASSGLEALSAVLRQEFAVIILDAEMPEMSGYETAALIKQREKSCEVPILFVTAIYKDEVNVSKAYQAGGVDYIIKPFDPAILKAKVGTYVALYRKARRIEKKAQLLREQDRAAAELKLAEARHKSELRFRELVDHLDHAIVWVADAATLKFSFVAKNAELLLGYPLKEWFCNPTFIEDRSWPEDTKLFMNAIEKARVGENIRVEHRMVAKDQSVHWFQSGMHLDRSENSENPQFRGVCVDITALKTAQAQTQELREQFVQSLTHDLRSPMAAAIMACEIILQNPAGHPKDRELASRAVDSLNRMDKMTTDLLDASCIQSGQRLPLKIKEVDLPRLVRETLEDMTTGHLNRFIFNSEKPFNGHWDKCNLRRVIENLVNNALKYGAPETPITISVQPLEGDRVGISVHNDGAPISPQEQASLFEFFHRAPTAQRSNTRGWGIGLTLVRGVTEAHGGIVRVQSDEKIGTIFTIELPRDSRAGIER